MLDRNEKRDILIKYGELKKEIVSGNRTIVIDARPEKRFLELEEEPRTNIGKGKIPKSVNIPFYTIQQNGYIKSKISQKIFLR